MARHGGGPVGSAARDATARPYAGLHRAHELDGIALMNIAAADDESLSLLRDFFAKVADHGTEGGKQRAPAYLAAIDDEILRRRPLLTTYDDPPDDPPRCTSCGHLEADECGCTCCTWTCDERPANV